MYYNLYNTFLKRLRLFIYEFEYTGIPALFLPNGYINGYIHKFEDSHLRWSLTTGHYQRITVNWS